MSKQMLEIKYRCMHPSCCVNCREGLIGIDEGLFQDLSSFYEDKELFRSPHGICRLGFSQAFKVITMTKEAEGGQTAAEELPLTEDPIAILIEEHRKIISLMESIQNEHLRKRDMDGLWAATAELENHITLHSGLKEEEALFPALRDLLPFGEGLVAIVKEEHREIMSLLHNFRKALEEDNIMDGIIRSMIVSLKSHIRKEDYEFFELINKCLNNSIRKKIVEDMKRVEAVHVPIVAGERRRKKNEQRDQFDEDILAVRDLVNVDGGCCGHG